MEWNQEKEPVFLVFVNNLRSQLYMNSMNSLPMSQWVLDFQVVVIICIYVFIIVVVIYLKSIERWKEKEMRGSCNKCVKMGDIKDNDTNEKSVDLNTCFDLRKAER